MPEEPSPEDALMELAARLEGDGGLPGKHPQERVLCTMVALLYFLSQDGAIGQGPFSRHLMLMTKFLAPASLPALGGAFERIKERALEAAHNGEAVPGDWLTLARQILSGAQTQADNLWQEIEKQFK